MNTVDRGFIVFLALVLIGSMFVAHSFCSHANSGVHNVHRSVSDGLDMVPQVVHDVAIVDVSSSAAEVYAGEIVRLNVLVRNEGTVAEAFDVTTCAEPVFLGTQSTTTLAPQDEETLIFTWNTTDIVLMNYTVSANASIVSGEIDVADNVFVGGIIRVVDAVAVYVDPSSIAFSAPSYGTRFGLAVNIWNVTDLYAFAFSLSWNSSLIRLISHEIKPIWPSGQYYVVTDAADVEAGTYHVIVSALGNTIGHNVTVKDEAIVTFAFEVESDPSYPSYFSSPILLENVELSDSYGAKIDCYVRSGDYLILSGRPRLFFTPSTVGCRADESNVTVEIRIRGAIRVSGFNLHIKYDPTFLDATEAVFADFLQDPCTKAELRRDDEAGYIHFSLEQQYPVNGSGILAMVTFKVNSSVVYRWWAGEISTLSSSVKLVESELNVTFPEGILRQEDGQVLAFAATFALAFNPGDLNLDGIVDIGDLIAIAGHYGCGVGCRFDLNEDGIVDIYDLVRVALNFGKSYTE